ncbi:MAG TPA: OmpW family outer membrane protein [Candidatus Aminicenantes bacterium]|nr:OmpW family outer membrane protein [Candidatus Aminicenantes bacterium]
MKTKRILAFTLTFLFLLPVATLMAQTPNQYQDLLLQSESGKLRIGLTGQYNMMVGKGFSGVYGKPMGIGLNVSYQFADEFDLVFSYSYSSKKKPVDWLPDSEDMQFKLYPIQLSVRYYFLQKDNLLAYTGAGVNYVIFKDVNPLETIDQKMPGFNALVGIYYKLSDDLYFQTMAQFNLAQKSIHPDAQYKLDLTNLNFQIGLAYGFDL